MATNPLLNPNQQLSGNSLQQAAQQLTNAQIVGPLAELAKQIARNNQQGTAAVNQAGGYFNSLGNFAKQGAQQETGIANDLNSRLQGIGNDTQGQLNRIGWQGLGGLVAHAPQGENQSQSSPAIQSLVAELARQEGSAANDAGTFRSAGATQGANYRGLASSNLGTFALKGQEALKGIAQATRLANEPINQKIANLQASKGALLASNEGKLRQQEITNQVTRQGLGLKAQGLAIAQQNNLANQGLRGQANSLRAAAIKTTLRGQDLAQMRSDRTFQLNSKKFGAAQAKNLYLKQHGLGPYRVSVGRGRGGRGGRGGGGGGRGLSLSQNTATLGKLSKAIGVIQQAQATGKYSEQQIRSLTASKYGIPDFLVQAAYELIGYGRISPRTAAAMHRAGIRGGTFRGRPIVVSKGQGRSFRLPSSGQLIR